MGIYLTDSRLPQDQAVAFHSHLLEEALLSKPQQCMLLGSYLDQLEFVE